MAIPLPTLPPDNTQICLTIPNSPEWRQIFMGALQILSQWWYWDVNNPSDGQDVVQRVMECLVITGNDYEGCMAIDCNDIIDCINNPESGVMQAILSNLSKSDEPIYRDTGQGDNDLELGSGNNPNCDMDKLFGGLVSVIDRAHENNMDSLQILEVSTNVEEWVAEVATGVFGIEAPVMQSIIDWANFIQNSILENYEAQITTAYLETLYCDLFCLTRNSCVLTPEILTDYFYERLGSQLTYQSLLSDSINFLIGGVWVGTEIADAMFLSQFMFRAQLGKWFSDIAFGSIDLDFRLGIANPNSTWQILCTTCEWREQWLDGDGQGSWYALATQNNSIATYDAINDQWIGDYNDEGTNRANIKIDFASTNITYISATLSIQNENDTNPRPSQIFINGTQVYISNNLPDGDVNIIWNGTDTATSIEIWTRADQETGGLGEVSIKQITVRGTGVNPFS